MRSMARGPGLRVWSSLSSRRTHMPAALLMLVSPGPGAELRLILMSLAGAEPVGCQPVKDQSRPDKSQTEQPLYRSADQGETQNPAGEQ